MGALGPALDFGSSALNTGMNFLSARGQRKWTEKMWDKQNKYNTPQNQVARMKAAGLSPALMYKGSPDNTASSPGTYDRGKADLKEPQLNQKLLQQADTKVRNQQLENMSGDLDLTKMRTITESYRALQMGAQTEKTQLESERLMGEMQGIIRKTDADAAYAEGRVDLQKLEKAIAENKVTTGVLDNAYKEYRNQLWKDSRMTMDDSMLLRMFVGVLQNIGPLSKTMSDWVEEQKKALGNIKSPLQNRPGVKEGKNWRDKREKTKVYRGAPMGVRPGY